MLNVTADIAAGDEIWCDEICPGDNNHYCGGSDEVSVYRVQGMEELKGVVQKLVPGLHKITKTGTLVQRKPFTVSNCYTLEND